MAHAKETGFSEDSLPQVEVTDDSEGVSSSQSQTPDDRGLTAGEMWNLTFALLAWACTVTNVTIGKSSLRCDSTLLMAFQSNSWLFSTTIFDSCGCECCCIVVRWW